VVTQSPIPSLDVTLVAILMWASTPLPGSVTPRRLPVRYCSPSRTTLRCRSAVVSPIVRLRNSKDVNNQPLAATAGTTTDVARIDFTGCTRFQN
jgi:hypothetical protein